MEKYLAEAFAQLDKQLVKKIEARELQLAYIKLNNLYLSVESGKIKMSIHIMNDLYRLAETVDPHQTSPIMSAYWLAEFEKLPNWFKF